MSRLLRSELIKVRTTRLWWGMLIGLVALVALNVVPAAFFAGQDFGGGIPATPGLDEIGGLTAVYGAGYQSGYLIVMVLGVIIGATDRRHRTDTQTYLATPRRGRVIVAKMIVAALVGLVYGVVAELTTVGVAAPVIASRHTDLGLGLQDADVLRGLVLGVPGIALWGVIGVALGILLRNQIAAVLVGLGYVFLGDFLVAGGLDLANLDAVVPYTPINASNAIVGGFTSFELLEWWGGVLVLLGYGVAIAVAGWLIGRTRDIT